MFVFQNNINPHGLLRALGLSPFICHLPMNIPPNFLINKLYTFPPKPKPPSPPSGLPDRPRSINRSQSNKNREFLHPQILSHALFPLKIGFSLRPLRAPGLPRPSLSTKSIAAPPFSRTSTIVASPCLAARWRGVWPQNRWRPGSAGRRL